MITEPEDQTVFEPPVPPPNTLIGKLTTHPLWTALSADIFTGQIIASLIVLTFVAIFLLREWISQNARPGVFEDEEPLPEIPVPQQPMQPPLQPPVQQQPPQQPGQAPVQPAMEGPRFGLPLAARRAREGFPDDERLRQRQIEALRAIEAMRTRNAQLQHGAGGVAAAPPPRWDDEEAIQKVLDAVGRKRRRNEAQGVADTVGKGKQTLIPGGGPRIGAEAVESLRMRQKRRSIALAKKGRHLLKGETTPTPSFLTTPNQGESSSNFKFPTAFPIYSDTDASASSLSPPASRSTVSPNPNLALPFSLRPTPASTSSTSTPSPGPYPPRPPLPNTVIDGLPSPATPRALGSPSLATYRAPEEFGTPEAGPSRSSYFATDDSSVGSLVAERSATGAPVFVEDEEDRGEDGDYEFERFPDDREDISVTEDEDDEEEYVIKHFPDGGSLPEVTESAEMHVGVDVHETEDENEDEEILRTPLLERLQAAQSAKLASDGVWGLNDGSISDMDIDMEAETKRFFREQRDRTTSPLLGETPDGQGSGSASRSVHAAVHASGTDTSDAESGESGEDERGNINLVAHPEGAAAGAGREERREHERVWQRVVIDMNDEAGLFRDGDEEEEEPREDDFEAQWVEEEDELELEADDGEPHGDLGPAGVPPPPLAGAPAAPAVPDVNGDAEMAAALEANEDLEAGEDEMEGAMEGMSGYLLFNQIISLLKLSGIPAVGLRGPVFGVLQNVRNLFLWKFGHRLTY